MIIRRETLNEISTLLAEGKSFAYIEIGRAHV